VILEVELEELKKAVVNDRPENCEGILGYEEDPTGDGLAAEYFDNEDFVGSPVKQTDPNIDFDWNGEAPVTDINHENFSIQWTGYILAPVSSLYRFTTVSDDGNALYINGQEIISHNMGAFGTTKTWMEAMHAEEDSKSVFKTSSAINLIGGVKYQLKMLAFHSVHNEHEEGTDSFVRLKWESDLFNPRIVDPSSLYLGNKIPPLKVTAYFSEDFQLFTLQNFADAFFDSELYKLDDIPLQFQNLNQLRGSTSFSKPEIFLETNIPTTVYIAVSLLEPNPLGTDFLDSQEVMSILKISKNAKPINNVIKAKESIPYRIYRKNFLKGEI